MPKKTLRRRARDGELVQGVMVFECFTPGVATLAHLAGAEFVLFDMEHSGLSIESLKGLVSTCRGLGIAPMARVPRGEYHLLAPALDVGCQGIMIPMVESADQAQSIVEATRYPPTGRRGAAFGFAHDDYETGDIKAKIRMLDARNTVIAQIETERGLENVEAIAAVKEIDVLWVGHFRSNEFPRYTGRVRQPALSRGDRACHRSSPQIRQRSRIHGHGRKLVEAVSKARFQHASSRH